MCVRKLAIPYVVAVHVVLSVLAPTQASGISRHYLDKAKCCRQSLGNLWRFTVCQAEKAQHCLLAYWLFRSCFVA